jgi:aminoglycoside 6'-N-acetyltransferase I
MIKTSNLMIREIQSADIDAWIKLRHDLWPTHSTADLTKECSEILGDNLQKSWICFESGEPVGFIDVSIKAAAIGCKSDRIGYVEGWYVKPSHQGRGIGQQLYRTAENWARTQRCQEMASDTTQDYPHSIRAHEAAGFRVARIATHFCKDIST